MRCDLLIQTLLRFYGSFDLTFLSLCFQLLAKQNKGKPKEATKPAAKKAAKKGQKSKK